jgi:glycerophosphoryl diester phosphodiesterase
VTAAPPLTVRGAAPRISGHRGSIATDPENTIRSFRRAIADGAGTFELDVQCSSDGALIVMHDSTVDRMTDGTGSINDLDLAAIKRLSVDGDPVPTFEEVVDAVDAPIQVEVKDPLAVEPMVALLRARPEIGRRVVLTGFSEEVLRKFAAALPEVPRGLICRGYDETLIERAIELGCSVVYSGWPGITAEAVDALHAAGLTVAIWMVNTHEELMRALAVGADEIASDDPAQAARWLAVTP